MRILIEVLATWLIGSCWAAGVMAEAGKAMPNRLLVNSWGRISSQKGASDSPDEASDILMRDWTEYAAFMKETGFTGIAPIGMLANKLPYPFEIDTKSEGTDIIRISSDKLGKVRQIIAALHDNQIEYYYFMCLYFAYWKDFLNAYPEAKATEAATVCPTYPGEPARGIPSGIGLTKQGIDFVVQTLPMIDGIHMESSHYGRCKCRRCLERFPDTPRGTAEFHRYANDPIFQYIREKYPKLKIHFNPHGPFGIIEHPDNLDIAIKTAQLVDSISLKGYQPEFSNVMKRLAAACPKTGFMIVENPWHFAHGNLDPRDGWFLPNLNQLGRNINERAKIIDWAGVEACGLGVNNPCENVNLRFLARIQMTPKRNWQAVAKDVLREVYAPKNSKTLGQLFDVFNEPEIKFRALWPHGLVGISSVFRTFSEQAANKNNAAEQVVDYINANQLGLTRLRAIKSELGNQKGASRLETSIENWIHHLKDEMKKDYSYSMP